ncbi:antiviral RADAR system adenosine triphosphatase RdrA [Vibrio splendidus]|uniref:antiviral RADAR system adenosine triphosphatase RdrA n=1 Tax=Vibrio splendidus TaxID=29497 RepID=UPI001E31189B|nr:antiviral RADAR system adenosine triphosphatase RdrA [Vibrio splendidus]MCC4788768.1 KAP family NTPase [Vibrio splendidus]
MSPYNRYIPLNSGESAVLPDAKTLLPRDEVYEPLAKMIIEAVKKVEAATNRPLNELREHSAISIDGARGTGKTAVLVNLKSYLKDQDVLKDVHILDPVDPTLLEDGDSLFLHIIVAAVLHDKDVKDAQRKAPNKARSLNQTLENLAQSLESVETQKDSHGMDKVRAMYSNKNLADCVQDFFREVTYLLEKKLLILPIDDVDTSLNRAFENLEIVRRYLATPHVLPIVCGDRELYNDVTWRDFHGRLTKDSSYCSEDAYEKAVELAAEYQRKILPFTRRLSMPPVSAYWQQSNIYLRDGQKSEVMSLRSFIIWMESFLSGPVNGLEGSKLILPIPSIRALTQLVRHCSDLIPQLPASIRSANSELEIRRSWQMLPPQDVMEPSKINDMVKKLADYFCYEPKAGVVYLLLLAKQHWNSATTSGASNKRCSIFDTPLFQPLTQSTTNFDLFDKANDLSAWPSLLEGRLPEEWLTGIKSYKTILPYPVAEVGVNSSRGWNYNKEIQGRSIPGLEDSQKNKASFLIALLGQSNFYTNAKQTMLLNIGRVFELLIASIVGPLSAEDIHAIMRRAPFFSTAALAPTKTITFDVKASKSPSGNIEGSADTQSEECDLNSVIETLHQEIEEWRETCNVNQIDLSPWLVYKVFNKVYSQVASAEYVSNGMKQIGTALNMVAHSFYSTWFAFGSFEKGELFGLPNVVATTNINRENLKNYTSNDQYNVNIKPIMDTFKEETDLNAVSIVLNNHPLKKWIDEVIKFDWSEDDIEIRAEDFLRKELGINTKNVTKSTIKTQAKKQTDGLHALYEQMKTDFGDENKYTKLLKEVSDELHKVSTPSSSGKEQSKDKDLE